MRIRCSIKMKDVGVKKKKNEVPNELLNAIHISFPQFQYTLFFAAR